MISVILVNYHTARHTLEAVASVRAQQDTAETELFVVDNSVSEAETALLEANLPTTATFMRNAENIGFARACNQAFELTTGEFILLLNPDARLLPGALSRLADTLTRHPDAGAVGPRVYWDDERRFLMPPSTFPSITGFYQEAVSRAIARFSAYPSLQFRKKALQAWRSDTVFPVDALSGGHVLIRRSAVQRSGGLFDPQFFMYWEDSDLMHRLKQNGYRLYLDPAAGCLHYYEHSPAKDQRIAQGWPAYLHKHLHKTVGFRLADALNRRLPPVHTPDIATLTVQEGKLRFPVPIEIQDAWLLEIGVSPQLIPAIGHFGNGPVAEIDAALFQRLQQKMYFARLSAPTRQPNLLYYWQWQGCQHNE